MEPEDTLSESGSNAQHTLAKQLELEVLSLRHASLEYENSTLLRRKLLERDKDQT